MEELLQKCIVLAQKAGTAVMEIYETGDLKVEYKSDDSPLTRADKLADQIIEDGLKKFSEFPIISEEGNHLADSKSFWLVDPIDGTKEFIKHNGEFTINIGLIEDGAPVLGVIYAPAKKVMYYAVKNQGAFKQKPARPPEKISAVYEGKNPVVAISRSHLNEDTEKFLDSLGAHQTIVSGSSLKLCYVAEGKASVYPRLSPSSIWDTAAGDAIVREAGGKVADLTGKPLNYDPAKLLNPNFVAGVKNNSF